MLSREENPLSLESVQNLLLTAYWLVKALDCIFVLV